MVSRTLNLLLVALILLTSDAAAQAPCAVERAKLFTHNGAFQDDYGKSVTADGKTLAVGVPKANGLGADSGAVFIYTRVGTNWSLEATLTSSNPRAGEHFGNDLDLEGDTLAVGAPSDSSSAGSVYVFQRTGTLWTEIDQLQPATSLVGDRFGWSLALSGDSLLIGAPTLDILPPTTSGDAYVFERSAGSWTETTKLTPLPAAPPLPPNYSRLGLNVALDGDTAVVTAEERVIGESGRAYVFERSGSVWTNVALFYGPVSFGQGLAVDGDLLVVGQPFEPNPWNTAYGQVNTFERSSGIWSQSGPVLYPSNPTPQHAFGGALAIEKNVMLVGAFGDNSMYVFKRNVSASWLEQEQVRPSNPQSAGVFGYSLEIDGQVAVIGDPTGKGAGTGTGTAYAFTLGTKSLPILTYCVAKQNSCAGLPAIDFTGRPDVAATSGFDIFARGARFLKTGLLVYSPFGQSATPFSGGVLCVTPAGLSRGPAVTALGGQPGSCESTLLLDMNAFASGNAGGNPKTFLQTLGQQVNVQWIGRDTLSAGPFLSDGLQYVVE